LPINNGICFKSIAEIPLLHIPQEMEQAPEGFVARKAKGGDLGGAKGGENELGKLVLRIF